MKKRHLFCIAVLLAAGLVHHAEAGSGHYGGGHYGGGWSGGHYGGWHGGPYYGGGWRGGCYPGYRTGFFGSLVIAPPIYSYPGYYRGYYPGYYGSAARPVYYGREVTDGSLASDVQAKLARAGYYRGTIDGIIGPESRSAIVAYKRDRGLGSSSRIDASLLRSLNL